MIDPAATTNVDLSPAILLGPYGVTLACAAVQQIFNKKPQTLALALSFLTAIVTLGDSALANFNALDGSTLSLVLFWLKEVLLFVFGGFGVFSAAMGMNKMSSSGATFGAAPGVAVVRRWNTPWDE